jgi:hypothetical protein
LHYLLGFSFNHPFGGAGFRNHPQCRYFLARLGSLATSNTSQQSQFVQSFLSDVKDVKGRTHSQNIAHAHMNLIHRLACDVLLRTQICPRQMKVLEMCLVIRFFDLESIDESIELTAKMGVSRNPLFLGKSLNVILK